MISVVIPAHNERENLSRLLPYLLEIGQEMEVEILPCLSAGTSDGSGPLLAEMGIEPIFCGENCRASQMNNGARSARGETLVFLHADVWPAETFFKDIRATLSQGYHAGFFSYQFDTRSTWLRINGRFTRWDGMFTGGGDQCLFIRRDAFSALGGFDPNQVLMEDFEFFKRLKRAGLRYCIVPNDLTVSARKYEANSYLRVNLSNLLLLLLFRLGCSPDRLRSLHNRLIRSPEKIQ